MKLDKKEKRYLTGMIISAGIFPIVVTFAFVLDFIYSNLFNSPNLPEWVSTLLFLFIEFGGLIGMVSFVLITPVFIILFFLTRYKNKKS